MNGGVLNSAANSSGPSVGASSLVTDANSALAGGPQLQHSVSTNNDTYLRLPASPMSFSSNNFAGSSVMDGSSIVQQASQQETLQKHGGSSATSQPTVQDHPASQFHLQKKMRMDMRQEDALQQQMIQQLLQRQDSIHLQGHPSPHLQAVTQQPRLVHRQQQQPPQPPQQILQQLPLIQRAQVSQQQQQTRPHFQQQVVSPAVPVRRIEGGVCARRMMQYIYHQRHRPAENSILYWRKFVLEYFAPRSRKRWCLSMYDNVGNHALGVFPRAATEPLHCDICGSKTGKGFEAMFEVLPRLNQIKFDHGVMDELLFLDMPYESRLPSGMLQLEYKKAVQETVYEQLRVIREGQLRIIFSQELKILSWEFCARRHEEFFSRRFVAPQVSQLLQVAQKYQTAVTESGSAGIEPQDLQANCDMFFSAGRQIVRGLDLQTVNDMGFSKRFVRCLQIAEVVNSMKDLIDYSRQNKTGPIESLKNYSQMVSAKIQKQKIQEMDQFPNVQCSPPAAEQSTVNKILAGHPGLANSFCNNHAAARVLNNNARQTVAGLNNYQNSIQPDSSSSLSGADQGQAGMFHAPISSILANTGGAAGAPPHQQQQQTLNANPTQQNSIQASQMNHQQMQQQAIQQMLQNMMNNKGSSPQQQQPQCLPLAARNVAAVDGGAPRISGPTMQRAAQAMDGPGNVPGQALGGSMPPSRSNSFRSLGSSSAAPGGNSFNSRMETTPAQGLHLAELDQDIAQEFADDGMFSW